jgi:small subunit ribosomal protein S7e
MALTTEAAQKIFDEVKSTSEEAMKKALTNLKIDGVKEVNGDIKVVILSVPYKQIAAFRQVQSYIIPELEKKFDGAQVVIVGKRRAFPVNPVPGRRFRIIRPHGRTLRAVNDALLDDICFPTAIVGKRVHYNLQGKQETHVILDAHDRTRVEDRLQGFAAAYKRLTGLNTVFEI